MAEITIPHNFTPRAYQLPILRAMDGGYKRVVQVWHRRAGKEKTDLNIVVKKMLERVGSYYYVFPELTQGRKILWDGADREGFRFVDHFPKEILDGKPNDTEMKLRLRNGSLLQIVGSDRFDAVMGTNPIGMVLSEYSLQDPNCWGYFRPILAENDGWAIFNFTPRGENHAYDLYEMAKGDPEHWFVSLLTADDTGAVRPEVLAQEKKEIIRLYGNDALYQQEYFCFPPAARVWTSRGQIPISQVRIGDDVLSHAGRWRKVSAVGAREYSGELVTIQSAGSNSPLECTPEHPVRVCTPAKQTYQWVKAGGIKRGDYVVLPRRKVQRFKALPQDLAVLIAWFITEGSVIKTAVQFALGADEGAFADVIEKSAVKYGAVSRARVGNGLYIQVRSTWLADFLTANCGSGAGDKRIPFDLIAGNEHAVYEALLDGDGCRGDYSRVQEVYTTISYSLALDVQMLAHMVGKRATITRRPAEKGVPSILGRAVTLRDAYSVRVSRVRKTANGVPLVRPQKHGVAAFVRGVGRKAYSGKVYNLSVRFDESYVVEGRAVHNCSFAVPVSGAYYADQIQRLYADGRIGNVPHETRLSVDTWWDLGLNDRMAIWFTQSVGQELRVIDYMEGVGQGFPHYIGLLKEKGYIYGQHTAPHDIEVRELSSGKSRRDTAAALGINFRVAPRLPLADGIDAARALFSKAWFDKEKCKNGINALKNYRKTYDEKRKTYLNTPYHDWSSNASDSWRTCATGIDSRHRSAPTGLDKYARRSRENGSYTGGSPMGVLG